LNEKQIAVLQWVANGCPHGVYDQGFEHRVVARALERRGLVTICGRGPTWSAQLTAKGLEQQKEAGRKPAPPQLSEADQLIERVVAADGRLLLDLDGKGIDKHRRLVNMSLRSSARPRGQKLEMRSTGRWGAGPMEIRLTEHVDDFVDPVPVPVPQHVGKYHPAVKAFIEDRDWQYVTRDHVSRAARILQALADEAPKRGVDVVAPARSKSMSPYEARKASHSQLVLRTPAGNYSVKVKELPGRGGQQLAPRRWNERKTKPCWVENRGWEFIPSGRLDLIVDGPGTPYDGDHYRDVKTIKVEDRLPEVFRSFEIYQLRAAWKERERQREAEERRSRWEAAMSEARRRYDQDVRWQHFERAEKEWQRLTRQREFLSLARAAAHDVNPSVREALDAQLDLVADILSRADPLQNPEVLVPHLAEPGPEDLKPYLHGWSPLGPDGH